MGHIIPNQKTKWAWNSQFIRHQRHNPFEQVDCGYLKTNVVQENI
jgi:hypothetical protein